MKTLKSGVLIFTLLFFVSNVFAQGRSSQIEIFAGAAVPLSPDSFKDFYKVGGSIHGQYVFFPSPTVGISFGAAVEAFTFDGDKFLEDFGFTEAGIDVNGEATIVELGIGIRPYLTSPETSTQFYVFGMGTFNAVEAKATVTDAFGQEEEVKSKEEKIGIAAGGGLELPAGERINILIQGLVRFIFTDEIFGQEEVTTFVGVTLGVAF